MRTVCPVRSTETETPSTITLRFDYPPVARPGQFVMIWIPGDDELPMSLSYTEGSKGVTVKAMGGTSRHITQLRAGDVVGIRGPYGNTFDLGARNLLVVAGGSGAAVLAPAAEAAHALGARVTVALGATTSSELLFRERFLAMGADVHVATDDGSVGHRGFVTALLDRLLTSNAFDAVWTCGPEVMMVKVIAAGERHKIPTFCAIERHMKCGLGLCDACSIGPYHVCVDGPVFPAHRLIVLPEFGHLKRDPSGRLVSH
ncbi:MAG: dihydroorotate dehydrogenase electron transfer subunit [Thermoplasmata archaeon]|nr:dihydroorotate dehydrogenase electron transfer subunit [Thermoplasmata archaeon]